MLISYEDQTDIMFREVVGPTNALHRQTQVFQCRINWYAHGVSVGVYRTSGERCLG